VKDALIQVQVLYEIAMSIGNNLDLDKMLQNSLSVFLRKLNCSAGAVFEIIKTEETDIQIEPIYSIPRRIDHLNAYQESILKIPNRPDYDDIKEFANQLPLVGTGAGKFYYHVLNLPDFGYLVLIKANSPLETNLLHSLKLINNKLANDCLACRQNEEINRIVKQLKVENQERKKAEEAAKESHERFLTVMDSIDATIYVADMESYEILFMNKHMKDSFGSLKEGTLCYQAFRKESAPCRACTNSKLLDSKGNPTGVNIWEGQNPVTGKWYVNYDRAIKWMGRGWVRLQIATDITKIKKMEEQLRQSHKMEAVGTIAGGIAHDFNNILGIIIGNTELALADAFEINSICQYLEEIKTASLRAKDVVRQLLSFSRKAEPKRKPLEIYPMIQESIRLLRASVPSSIDIRSNAPIDSGIISADPTQIHQVIINLCTNAAHAMEDGGILEINQKEVEIGENTLIGKHDLDAGKYIQLTIKDTGSGIDPEIKDKIFDPYFTTKGVGKGTGMGLAVVHGIVKDHGGAISVSGEVNEGTTVDVLFPAIDEKPLPETDSSKSIPSGNEYILLIDDEESIARMGQQILEKFGYKVMAMTDPIKALEHFRVNSDQFDLVITDMTMPQMTGEKLIEEIIKIKANTPIILCSGFAGKMSEENSLHGNIRKYIEKPLNISEFVTSVREVLSGTKKAPLHH
jgi:signal transduction histidine kinase/CheY-like chemotaxis protein